jgi:hypothetical protein
VKVESIRILAASFPEVVAEETTEEAWEISRRQFVRIHSGKVLNGFSGIQS